jgi:hypothetical protein
MVCESEWRWFGNPGHFICSRWCRFHLCTQVGEYLVSTVGEYVSLRNSGGSERKEAKYLDKHPLGEEIGCDRFFETMVFKCGEVCSCAECGCGLPTHDGGEVDFRPANSRKSAAEIHMAMCRKWARR